MNEPNKPGHGGEIMPENTPLVRWFAELRATAVGEVGGKNASLGEMYSRLGAVGVRVPNGFALTARAYRDALAAPAPSQSSTRFSIPSPSPISPPSRGPAPRRAGSSMRRPEPQRSAPP